MKHSAKRTLTITFFKRVFLSITMLALFGSSAYAAICPQAKELKWNNTNSSRVFTDSGWEGEVRFYNGGAWDKNIIEFESAVIFTEAISQPGGVSCGYIAPNEVDRRNIPYIIARISPPNNPLGRIIGNQSNWEYVIFPTGGVFYRCSVSNGFSREECQYSLESGAHVNPYTSVRKHQ
jgi:hypothetical protein